ncbi:MAG TPA: Rieske (2Fe-2S) protein [Streptosporangiaceae bacterium]|jgi:nitrite reductase/ring-hydroxylating ferredoxin subunit
MVLVALGAADGRAAWTVTGAGRTLAVFVVEGRWYVTEARCPHNGGPLDQGWLCDGRVLTCPWHFYRFDLATGECQTTGGYQLACYPVLERDGEHYAEVPELTPPRSWSERLRAHAREARPGTSA